MARKIGQFKRLKTKGKYKSIDKYLDAIYRQNKELIDRRILNEQDLQLAPNREKLLRQSKKKLFKDYVKEYMDEGYKVDQAIKKVSNSRTFLEYEDLAKDNALSGLKEDKDAYREFRELTKEKGRYTKIDVTRIEYIGNNEYSYGNVIVSFKNSPKEVVVRKL